MGTIRLATTTTTFRRAVSLGGDGTAYITTWLDVEEDDEESGKAKQFTLPLVISYAPDGKVRLHGPAAHLVGVPAPLPEGVGADLSRTPPPVSQRNVLLTATSVENIVAGARIDVAALYADLVNAFRTFVAFPTGDGVQPDDYAAYLACYTLSTYLLPAFTAVGYLWLTGLPGSGKSTVAHVVARLACLPLMASASSTLAALRGHADAGGTLLLDNFETVGNRDDTARYLVSMIELGYQKGAVVPLQVPKGAGKGWETVLCDVFTNRAFTAVSDPPDALDSRCTKVLMFRTDDTAKASLAVQDDDNWSVPAHDLVQGCWQFSLFHLASAAKTVRTITSANTGLTNRNLQVWRPALTVARLVDEANGDTAVWDAVVRLSRWLLVQRADDDDSREAYVTRALIAMMEDGHATTTTSMTLDMIKKLYAQDHGKPPPGTEDKDAAAPFGLDNANKLGRLFKRMGVRKLPRQNRGNVYDLSEAVIQRLVSLYLPRPTQTTTDETARSTQTAQIAPETDEDRAESAVCADGVVSEEVKKGEGEQAWSDEDIPDWIREMPGAADD